MQPPSSIPAGGAAGVAADAAPAIAGHATCGAGKKAVIVGAGEYGTQPCFSACTQLRVEAINRDAAVSFVPLQAPRERSLPCCWLSRWAVAQVVPPPSSLAFCASLVCVQRAVPAVYSLSASLPCLPVHGRAGGWMYLSAWRR